MSYHKKKKKKRKSDHIRYYSSTFDEQKSYIQQIIFTFFDFLLNFLKKY